MKKKSLLLLVASAFALGACGTTEPETPSETSQTEPVNEVTKYTISFMENETTKIKDVVVNEGDPVSFNYSKPSTEQYSYEFLGWSLTPNGDVLSSLPNASQNVAYYAVFRSVLRTYTITLNFNCDADNKVITANYGTSYDDFDQYIPKRDGYHFAGWCSDAQCQHKITFPVTLTKNVTLYAKWNEKVEISKYLKALLGIKNFDPYSFIPESLRPTYEANLVLSSDVLDYSNKQNVSSIKTQGFGEQWQMVIDNMNQSEKFYNVLSASDSVFTAALTAFINYFEDNAHEDATNYEKEVASNYSASCSFANGVLNFSLEFKKSILGVTPKINMSYEVATAEKVIIISLSENNILKCKFSDNQYLFGISYGATIAGKTGLRTAYCELNKVIDEKENESIDGHIYEYFTYINDGSAKDITSSAADFYIDSEYCSVVGNKASGLLGFTGYINELYNVSTGRLYGYMVQEEREIPILGGQLVYHTFWFNLKDISGISNVKAVANGSSEPNKNNHDIYLNDSNKVFEPAYNKVLVVKKSSRKYDVEMRDHNYYINNGSEIVKQETQIPMMFIQDDDSYYNNGHNNTDFTDFSSDMNDESKITGAAVIVGNDIVNKIREDNINLVEIFKENSALVTQQTILDWLK